MLPTKSWLLTLLISASAAFDAPVYIFDREAWKPASNPPSLSPDQASLVFAQRLSRSKRHSLEGATESTLSYINSFGGQQVGLFSNDRKDSRALIMVVDGMSAEGIQQLLSVWTERTPAFTISLPTSFPGQKLVLNQEDPELSTRNECDIDDDINPFHDECWNGRSKAIYLDLSCDTDGSYLQYLIALQDQLYKSTKSGDLNVAVVLLPESASSVDCSSKAVQSKKAASRKHPSRRHTAEEPIPKHTVVDPSTFRTKQVIALNSSDPEPITGVPPRCHISLDSCVSATNNCSGHGECYKKSGSMDDASRACFTCGCVPQNVTFKLEGNRTGSNIIYWGGSACQKKDVSGPFWLIAIFSVVMVGLISWAIGLLYSIGEETLPGVIGAGVSSKAR